MFEDKAERVENNTPTKEIINDVQCEGFIIVAKTTVGIFMLGEKPRATNILPSKENILISFAPVVEKLKDQNGNARQQWDNVHLIVCHCPIDQEVLKDTFSKEIGNQAIFIGTDFMQTFGSLVTEEILKYKAFDLHDDLVAEANLEREWQQPKKEKTKGGFIYEEGDTRPLAIRILCHLLLNFL